MPDVSVFLESSLRTRDGICLFLRHVEPEGSPRARVFLIHGMGEHSSRYLHVAERLCQRGFGVELFDLRGHGRSGGSRGHIENYAQLLEDLALVWEEFHRADVPHFLYGHSLGGQLAVNFVLQRKPEAVGLIAASPWLDLAFAPKMWKLWLARLMVRFWPRFTQETDLRPERLSRDAAFLASMPDLDLIHHQMSARMYFEMTQGAANARALPEQMNVPLLLLQGEQDAVTSVAATRAFYNRVRSADKTLRLYPGGLHETHNDLDREIVLRDVGDWIAARC